MKKSFGLFGTLILGFGLVGCGGGINSGVDGSKKGSELTDDEAEKVCVATIEYSADAVSAADSCKIFGLLAYKFAEAANQNALEACEAARDECLDEAEKAPEEPDTRACGLVDADVLSSCDATVAEVEGCLSALIDRSASALKKIPDCAGLEGYELEDEDEDLPKSCEVVQKECPIALTLAGGID